MPQIVWEPVRCGPGQSALLTHFCGKRQGATSGQEVPDDIHQASPPERLDRILGSAKLRAFPPFGAMANQPMLCLSESTDAHLTYLIRECGWPAWGLVFSRRWVYDHGGAPVRHLRNSDYQQRCDHEKPWAIRLDPDSADRLSDWTHELEWRVPVNPADPSIRLHPQDLEAILVADSTWVPSLVDTGYLETIDGQWVTPGDWEPGAKPLMRYPELWQQVPHWIWDSKHNMIIKS